MDVKPSFPWNLHNKDTGVSDKEVLINRGLYHGHVVEGAICRILLALLAHFEFREEKKLKK